MKCGTFIPKVAALIERFGQGRSLYRIAKDSDLSYGTIHRWVNEGAITNVQTDQLFSFLVDGLGLDRETVERMTVGELFEYVTKEGAA